MKDAHDATLLFRSWSIKIAARDEWMPVHRCCVQRGAYFKFGTLSFRRQRSLDGWIDAGEDKAAKKGGLGLLALDIATRIKIKLARALSVTNTGLMY